MSWGRAVVLALVLLGMAVALPSSRAEHTPAHRYFVTGTVTNDNGEAVCGVVVRAADITSPSADLSDNRTATTDGSGRYTIQLHMHNGDPTDGATPSEVGSTIRVSIDGEGVSETTTAQTNQGNPDGWGSQTVELRMPGVGRGTCVDLLAVALWIGAVVAVVLGVLLAVFLLRRRGSPIGRSSRALFDVPGMTRVRARALDEMGIRTVKDLAGADPGELSKGNALTPKESRLLVKRANEALKK